MIKPSTDLSAIVAAGSTCSMETSDFIFYFFVGLKLKVCPSSGGGSQSGYACKGFSCNMWQRGLNLCKMVA